MSNAFIVFTARTFGQNLNDWLIQIFRHTCFNEDAWSIVCVLPYQGKDDIALSDRLSCLIFPDILLVWLI